MIYKYLRFDSGNAAVRDVAIHDEVSGSGQAFCVIKMSNASERRLGARLTPAQVSSAATQRSASRSMRTSISGIRR